MIVNKYNQGGGSGSGMTPQQVQQQIDTSLNPYWDSGETKDYVDEAVSGISLEGYYTSAQTEEAIISKNYVTSGQVKTQIETYGYATTGQVDSAFTYIGEVEQVTASGYTELHDGLMEVSGRPVFDSSAYYTSAQTEDAISAATSGKADKANVTPSGNVRKFPVWNAQGIITGVTGSSITLQSYKINGIGYQRYVESGTPPIKDFYAPQSAGTAGDILVSTGNGAPVWSAVTIPDMSAYYTSAQTDEKIASADTIIYASAVTYVDNAVSGLATEEYVDERLGREVLNHNSVEELLWDSGIFYEDEYGDTAIAHVPSDEAISYTINQLQESIGEVSGTFTGYTPTTDFATINGSAITEGGNLVIAGGGAAPDMSAYYTSAQTDTAISSALTPYYTSAQTQSAITAATQNMVTSTTITTMWKGTQAAYDTLTNSGATADSGTFYIIIPNNN